jgi:cytochrome c oxidase subunit 3
MKKITNAQIHPFHLVDISPWPILTAFSAFLLTLFGVAYMHGYVHSISLKFNLFVVILMMAFWWSDVITEASLEGQHTSHVQNNIRLGMILFICSEVMFFFAFFWAFFHSSFNPDITLGSSWPPRFLTTIDAFGLPLLNTIILLSSGCSITVAHNALIKGQKDKAINQFLNTILFAIIFTFYQYEEYNSLPYSISDSVYGSCFFMLTGFHGFHVIIGTIFIIVGTIRVYRDFVTRTHHLGIEAAILYWHFVDVVWLFLFICLYWLT